MIWQLLAINVVILALDVGLLVVEYLGLTDYEQSFKGIVYSVNLKMEFAILGKLKKVVRRGDRVLEAPDAGSNFQNPGSSFRIERS